MKSFLTAALLCCTAVTSANAVTVYAQPVTPESQIAPASEYVVGFGFNQQLWDNFSLASANSITGVSWVGSYYPTQTQPILSFTVGFYADDANKPGSVLFSQTFAGNANETSLNPLLEVPNFAYDVKLSSPFAAAAGTTYWVSIFAETNAINPAWGWSRGTGGDKSIWIKNGSNGGNPYPAGLDLAFTLDHQVTAVPEPSTLALSLVGLGTLLLVRRRATRA